MKTLITILICFTALAHADDKPKEISKASTKRLDVEAEVKNFYLQLTETDPETRKQVEALTARAREDYGSIYYASPPKVAEWFPTESNWDARRGSDMTGRFLVIQPIGYGRSKHAGSDTALIAEFEAVYESVTKLDPKHPDGAVILVSNKLTITFLGFRDPDLTAIAKPK